MPFVAAKEFISYGVVILGYVNNKVCKCGRNFAIFLHICVQDKRVCD
jgi:hypothetical protein